MRFFIHSDRNQIEIREMDPKKFFKSVILDRRKFLHFWNPHIIIYNLVVGFFSKIENSLKIASYLKEDRL